MNLRFVVLLVLLVSGADHAMGAETTDASHVEVAEGVVWRTSKTTNQHSEFLPPWTAVRIVNITGLRTQPRVGAYVTVIPLGVNLSPIELRITKSHTREIRCGGQALPVLDVELEAVQQKEFFEAAPAPDRKPAAPFDVAVLYPRLKSARQTPNEQLTKDMLPKDVPLNTVRAAIDTTGGQRPDIVIVKYCCRDRTRAAECDLTCLETYRKVRNVWNLIGTSGPC
jgi:hypothetical protein